MPSPSCNIRRFPASYLWHNPLASRLSIEMKNDDLQVSVNPCLYSTYPPTRQSSTTPWLSILLLPCIEWFTTCHSQLTRYFLLVLSQSSFLFLGLYLWSLVSLSLSLSPSPLSRHGLSRQFEPAPEDKFSLLPIATTKKSTSPPRP